MARSEVGQVVLNQGRQSDVSGRSKQRPNIRRPADPAEDCPRRSVSNGRVTCSGNRDQLTWSDVLPADRFACASDAGSGFAFSSSVPVLPGPAQRAKHFAGLKIGEHRSPRCNQGARGRSNCSAQCANRNLDGGNRSGVSDSASVLLIDARYDLRGSAFVIDDTSALASDASHGFSGLDCCRENAPRPCRASCIGGTAFRRRRRYH